MKDIILEIITFPIVIFAFLYCYWIRNIKGIDLIDGNKLYKYDFRRGLQKRKGLINIFSKWEEIKW